MKLKCVAIDDEPLALDLIKTYVTRIPDLQLCETFDDAISGIEYLNNSRVDLLFLDVNMPDISGIDLARALLQKPLIIFTTAYRQFAYEGFQLEAIDFLLKPLNFESFTKAVQKAIAYKKFLHQPAVNTEEQRIYVYSEYRLVQIQLRDIEYVESMGDYVKIHTGQEKPILSLMTLKKVMELLSPDKFLRIHRSYIINSTMIKTIRQRKIQMSTVELPIGRSYAEHLPFAKLDL